MVMMILQTLLLMAMIFVAGFVIGSLLGGSDADARNEMQAADDTSEPISAAVIVAQPSAPPPPATPPELYARRHEEPPAAPPNSTPVKTAIAPKPVTPPQADDLKKIRGVGPQIEAKLNRLGITAFAQIARWTVKDRKEINELLAFKGRIEREQWVKQASELARGDRPSGHAASIGKPRVLKKARSGNPDELQRVSGIGTAIANKLHAVGIYHFDQIAGWNAEQAEWIGQEIGFPGRVTRENWIAQAAAFAAENRSESGKRSNAKNTVGRKQSANSTDSRRKKRDGRKAP